MCHHVACMAYLVVLLRKHIDDTARNKVFMPKGLFYRNDKEQAKAGIVNNWTDYVCIMTTKVPSKSLEVTEKGKSNKPGGVKARKQVSAPAPARTSTSTVQLTDAPQPSVVNSSITPPIVPSTPVACPSSSVPEYTTIVVPPRPTRKRRAPSTRSDYIYYSSSHSSVQPRDLTRHRTRAQRV